MVSIMLIKFSQNSCEAMGNTEKNRSTVLSEEIQPQVCEPNGYTKGIIIVFQILFC